MNQVLPLDPTRLKEYSYLSKVAGPKPPFDMVLVKWRKGDHGMTELRFLASSEYLIATRTWTGSHGTHTDEDGSESGSVFVPAS